MPPRLALLALLVALAGCAARGPGPLPAVAPAPTAVRPTPLAGHLWLVDDPAALAAAAPPLPAILPAAPPAPPDPATAAAWAEPASRWVELELTAIAAESLYPPQAARALMLLGVAMSDGLVVAGRARAAGLEVSDRAVVAEAAARVIAAAHPRLRPLSEDERAAATWAGVWAGDDSVAGVLNGRQLGAAVAGEILAWAAADGSAGPRPPLAPPDPAPGVWAPTAPSYEWPQEPTWGQVRTVAIGDPASMRPPAPPRWGSPAMEEQIERFAAAQGGLTPERRAAATRWAAGAGTVTPPGLWMELARASVARRGLATPAAAGLYATLGVALHDSAVAIWDAKYHYWVARPIQAMAERDPAWAPLLKTPPHPSYPSGHAAFGGAASAVLAAAFPDEAAALARLADEAARSRVDGGIHWPMDGEAGLAQGAAVAAVVLGRLRAP